jgi:hypothetical protein
MVPSWLFQQDNGPKHTSQLMMDPYDDYQVEENCVYRAGFYSTVFNYYARLLIHRI